MPRQVGISQVSVKAPIRGSGGLVRLIRNCFFDPAPGTDIDTSLPVVPPSGRYDGLWEHQSGLALTSTDNPSWLVTVDETVDESVFNDLSKDIRKRWGAECVREPDKTKFMQRP